MCVRFYNDLRPTCPVSSVDEAYRLTNEIRGNVCKQVKIKIQLK